LAETLGVCACRKRKTIAAARRGLTLLEVLLTLGVLVIVASFAWPVLERMAESERLSKAADQVRARWAGARASAIDSGEMLVFRYTPGAERYRVERLSADGEAPPPCLARLPREQALPDGIRFGEEQGGPGQPPGGFDEPDADVDSLFSGDEWSQPILFCPDGTCSNAQIQLRNERGWSVRVALRGMTGVATVSRPQSGEEAGRLSPPGEPSPTGGPAEGPP
jgi:prepilin-type N-terminal cleavage/methylation domain-containing protein